MNVYTIYWIDGKRETVAGPTLIDAITSVGYGTSTISALSFYVDGEDQSYRWDAAEGSWLFKPFGNSAAERTDVDTPLPTGNEGLL